MSLMASLAALAVAVAQYLLFPLSFGTAPLLALCFGFLVVPFLVWELNGGALLVASGDINGFNRSIMVGRLTGLALSALSVVLLRSGAIAVAGVLLGQTFGFAASSFILWARLQKSVQGLTRPLLSTARSLAAGSIRLHASTIATFVILQSGILLLNAFSGPADAARYQVAVQMIGLILVLPLAASLNFTAMVAELGPEPFWPLQIRRIGEVLVLVLLLGVFAYIFAPRMILLLAGSEFEVSGHVFRRLVPVLVPLALAHLLSSQWFARGAFLLNSLVSVCAALLTVGIGYMLISRNGLSGAVTTDLIVQIGVVLSAQVGFLLWCNRRHKLQTVGSASANDGLPEANSDH